MREYPENISELIRMEFIAKNGKFLSKLNIMKARFVRSILDKKIPKHHQAFYKSLQSSPNSVSIDALICSICVG